MWAAAPELASPGTRLLGFSFWEVLIHLLNAVLFLLVGLQLHPILSELTGSSVATLVSQAALVSAVVIAVRVGLARQRPVRDPVAGWATLAGRPAGRAQGAAGGGLERDARRGLAGNRARPAACRWRPAPASPSRSGT
jgi:hypothetical protein